MKIDKQIESTKSLIADVNKSMSSTREVLVLYHAIESPSLELKMSAANLGYQLIDAGQRLNKLESTLAEQQTSRTQHLIAFEKESRIVNMNMAQLIVRAKRTAKSGKTAAANSIKDLITKYELEASSISQEDKNDLYFQIQDLLKFK